MGQKRENRERRFLVLVLSVLLFILSLYGVYASDVSEIYTTDFFGNAKTDFSPGEIVYLHGNGFDSGKIILLYITRPDGIIDFGLSVSDSFGTFVYSYNFGSLVGDYHVVASDGINSAELIFSDDAIWTTDGGCGSQGQDKNHYNVGDHIYINGDGFNSQSYIWDITGKPGQASCDPNIVVASGNFSVGANGSFCFDAYIVNANDCGEYQVKFGVKGDNYRVNGTSCGNGQINSGEQCELPSTSNNSFCNQSVSECFNKKLGVRDAFGNCDSSCGCKVDSFVYSCVKGQCGAECSINSDCNATKCGADGCVGEDYYDYSDSSNACLGSCVCERNSCAPPNISYKDPRCVVKKCGDGNVDSGEQCELPSTLNNSLCSQTREVCNGTKLGVRDAFGNCNASCGCSKDNFVFSCVKGRCGAECSINGDCKPNSCSKNYSDYCDGKKLGDYNGDNKFNGVGVSQSCNNTCNSGSCGCTSCNVSCSINPTTPKCVKGVCGAECSKDSDCDDGRAATLDSCDSNCGCVHVCINDKDKDCVCDDEDLCVDSRTGELVDKNGCDPFQFCGKYHCGNSCEDADFVPKYDNCTVVGNNNDLSIFTSKNQVKDCTTVLIENEGTFEPSCRPTTCAV